MYVSIIKRDSIVENYIDRLTHDTGSIIACVSLSLRSAMSDNTADVFVVLIEEGKLIRSSLNYTPVLMGGYLEVSNNHVDAIGESYIRYYDYGDSRPSERYDIIEGIIRDLKGNELYRIESEIMVAEVEDYITVLEEHIDGEDSIDFYFRHSTQFLPSSVLRPVMVSHLLVINDTNVAEDILLAIKLIHSNITISKL